MPDYRDRPPVDQPRIIVTGWRLVGCAAIALVSVALWFGVAVATGLAFR